MSQCHEHMESFDEFIYSFFLQKNCILTYVIKNRVSANTIEQPVFQLTYWENGESTKALNNFLGCETNR